MKKINKRSDNFFYIELWNEENLREKRLSKITGTKDYSKPKYLSGTLNRLITFDKIYYATFWKTEFGPKKRIDSLKSKTKYRMVIKHMSREEFFNIIPDKQKDSFGLYLDRNIRIKKDEIKYIEKLEKQKINECRNSNNIDIFN